MAAPLTWSLVGVQLVTEGIKFLYGQATEALKRVREKKQNPAAPTEVPIQNPVPDIFTAKVEAPVIHVDTAEKLETELLQMRADLAEYADDLKTPSPNDPQVLEQLDVLRRLMEAVYRQPLTFQGETREETSTRVDSELYVQEVAGYVAAVRARVIRGGAVESRLKVDRVHSGGTAIGIDVDTIE